ncbi:ABC transporter permease [Roseivirga misakiensis]|uniref:ABC transporter permease n=1 Tax=Roseivirga misakiensis TaxID=1563681 RepID=A0A1E5SLK1_9BACT|nr:ABC transporter permease [Roseivirga misakiensis]OEJ99926.1 hypothetical protein BFP71_10290 [Roseivirga misakiensis]
MVKIFFNLVKRNFLKDKVLNTLSLLGLSLGLTASALILLFVDHELSFDTFHADAKNIYRIEAQTNSPSWSSNLGIEHNRELISGKYPEVESIVEVINSNRIFLSFLDKGFWESNVKLVAPGSDFFHFFDFELIEGNRQTLLDVPNAAVLTKSTARKYFGESPAIGRVLKYDTQLLKVTGVIADLPTNTHLSFDIIYTNGTAFTQDHYHADSYIKLSNNVLPETMEDKIMAMEGVAEDEFHELTDVKLLPIADIHFKSQADFGSGASGDMLQLSIFMVIGLLILLIATANYINLSMAIFSSKSKEVGMRKVLGESKSGITKSFFLESCITIFMTIPLALLGLGLLLPKLNQFMGLNMENKFLSSPTYWLISVLFVAVLSFATIIYPALTLTQSKVSTLLKSKVSIHSSSGIKLRNILIFFQFALLFTLGISAWFMNQQISYLDNKDMGFETENIVKITNAYELGEIPDYYLFKNELKRSPQISGVTFGPMIGDGSDPLAYKPEGQNEIFENLLSYGVDVDYFDVMGIEILAGDFKNTLNSADSGQVISVVNTRFINDLGWQDDPIGKKMILRPGTENELNRKVTAVFKDFHYFSLKEKISPQIISLKIDPDFINTNILVRASNNDLKATVEAIESAWQKIQSDVPMQYEYMDDAVKRLYKKDKQTGQITILFSLLAVGLSFLGLTGFMVYMIGLKSKEIAVRKVLGATLLQVIALLNKQLFTLILISAIIGSALSFLLIDTWLQDYAYSIPLRPTTFVLAALIVYMIVFLITSLQSLKSAQLNPTNALKNE